MIDSYLEKPFKIYQSSAGSGKTYTLVKEYISIILKSDNPNKFRQILAVTFTNKAATEMKERVLEALSSLGSDNDEALLKDFAQSTGLKKEEVVTKSKKAYKNIIHHYGDFNILTIDKFIHRIIRSFARELDLSLNFEIESDVDTFLQRSIGVLLDNVGIDTELTKYLIRYSEKLIEDGETGDIEKKLLHLTRILKNEETRKPLSEFEKYDLSFFTELGKKNKEKEKELKLKIKPIIDAMVQLLESQGLDIEFFNGKLRSGWGALIHKYYTKGIFFDRETPIKHFEEETWYSPKKHDAVSGIITPMHDLMKKLIEIRTDLNFTTEFNKQLVGFSLLNSIHKILAKVKTENNIVFISDFNEIISKIVQNEPAPFVYEKIGARFKNYLIDEFQDTSSLQWTNLVPLVHDSLSEGNKNLIVGDAKQAIYRWRNGNVQQFIDLPEVKGKFTYLTEINTIFKHTASRENLTNNYRSARSIIQFNNWLFNALAADENEKIQRIYEESTQTEIKKQVGFVQVKVVDKEAESPNEIICENTLKYINQCKLDGFTDGDIAILVRGKKDGIVIAEFLKEAGYPVVSADSIVLGSSKEVLFLVAFLEAFGDIKNEHASIKCIDYLKKDISLTEVYDKWRIPNKNNENYTIGIDLKGFLTACYPDFNENYYLSLNLYDKFIYLIDSFQLNRYDPYLDELLNTVHHYLQRNTSSIQLFTEFFEKKKESIFVNLGSVDNAIQVMTIHKSKGLQFPVVIIPYAKWKNKGGGGDVDLTWIEHEKLEELNIPKYVTPLSKSSLEKYNLGEIAEKENEEAILDNLNMYYVAFTRAAERLYVITKATRNKTSVTNKIIGKIINHPDFIEKDGELTFGELEKNSREIAQKLPQIQGCALQSKRKKLNLSLDRNAHVEDVSLISEREMGIIVHAILSEIKSQKDVQKVADEMELRGMFDATTKNEAVHLIDEIFSISRVNDWFQEDEITFNECEIISKDGHFYIPDKVLIRNDKAVVIDFKTGKELKKHSLQITEYGNLLQEMGYSHVEKHLLYTHNLKIVTL